MAISDRIYKVGSMRLDREEHAAYLKLKQILDQERMTWRDFAVQAIRRKVHQAEKREQKENDMLPGDGMPQFEDG